MFLLAVFEPAADIVEVYPSWKFVSYAARPPFGQLACQADAKS